MVILNKPKCSSDFNFIVMSKIKVGNKIVRKTLSTLFMDAKKLWQPECQKLIFDVLSAITRR